MLVTTCIMLTSETPIQMFVDNSLPQLVYGFTDLWIDQFAFGDLVLVSLLDFCQGLEQLICFGFLLPD